MPSGVEVKTFRKTKQVKKIPGAHKSWGAWDKPIPRYSVLKTILLYSIKTTKSTNLSEKQSDKIKLFAKRKHK